MDARYTGEKIIELRKEKGWTQKDIADRLHVSVSAVSKWERGLNYPDLSLMEPLAGTLGITVLELLGIEDQPTETVIRNITEISEKEKVVPQKTLERASAVIMSAAVFAVAAWIIYLLTTNVGIIKLLFDIGGGVGVFNLAVVLLGVSSVVMAIMSIFSLKKTDRWKVYSFISFILCAVALHIPTFITYLVMRFEYVSTVEDTAGAYFFGSAVLLIGCTVFNLCSLFVHKNLNGL